MKKAILFAFLALTLVMTPVMTQNTQAQGSPVGTLEFEVPPHGTYLIADTGRPSGGRFVGSPLIIDLAANGLVGGEKILISYNGTLYPSAHWDGTLGYSIYQNNFDMWAVFSTSNMLLDVSEIHRVPGAIQTTKTTETPITYNGKITDIPEDFEITPYTGMETEIPLNARYMFVCVGDVLYTDNEGAIKIMIEEDSDGDGLPNSWEINGIDVDKDGQIDLHLQALGADWEHKDIFVEIDYLGFSGSHTHRPDQGAVNDVIQAFDLAWLVENPDNSRGINLHVYIDEALPHNDTITWPSFDQLKASHFGTAAERTNPKNIEAKKQAFHYCIFAHSQVNSSSSGSGEMPGNDFMVTLGNWTGNTGTREEQAATFMHELGHNLGLHHGGKDAINYKPNYISVMNYLFQTDTYNTGRALDYSWGDSLPLNEANLNETDGIGSYDETVWVSPNGTLCSSGGLLEIDWNFDGNVTRSVAVNVNNHVDLDYQSPAGENLTDFDDWSNLVYRFRGTLGFADGQHPMVPEEITLENVQTMRQQALSIADPVIPEFAEWLLLPVIISFTLILVMLMRKRKPTVQAC
jgi:hypothetical protein